MKWYAYTEDFTTYTMILDHNTTVSVAWNSSGNNSGGPVTVNEQLAKDTKTWITGLNPRLITAQEVANITGNTTWAAGDSWFYLDSNTTTQTANSKGKGKYAWLFDYTRECTSNGCNIADSGIVGYWTSTPRSSGPNIAWVVGCSGTLHDDYVTTTELGLRPVITVPKDLF